MPELIAYSIAAAAKAIGVSRATLYVLLAEGKLEARKLGGRTLILAQDLQAFAERLPVMKTGKAS